MAAQDTLIVHTDTLDARELTRKADDSYLLEIVGRQSIAIASREDSIHRWRLENDTTTIIPLHLGYADSLRCADQVKKQGGTTPLCLPLLYFPQKLLSLKCEVPPAGTMYETAGLYAKDRSEQADCAKYDVREEARRYITTHAAGLYKGVAREPLFELDGDVTQERSLYELEIPGRSLVSDAEAEARERLQAIKNQNNPWFKEANLMLQTTQNYVSANWYEGGNSSFAIYGSAKGTIKYDDKKRYTWENYAEWTAGGSTVAGDSLRKVNCSDDLFRLYSKFGIKIVDKIYGSFSAEYRMQVFPTYKSNTRTLKTGFATPIRFNLALGIDYKPIKGLSVVFSPGAFKLVYANDTLNSPYTSYGIPKGQKTLAEFGTSARVEWTWKPLREVSLETKFYTYTNYRMIEIDLEVACDFIINRFITTRIILHPRYDSTRIMDSDTAAKIQFKELISVGFAHKFY